jgi:regulator of RNase E activity RraA
VLPWEIQGLTIEHRVAGVAMPVEGQPTASQDPEEIYVPMLKMLGDLKPGDVIVSQPHDSVSAHIGELSAECAKFRGARGAVIDGGARDIDYILKLGFRVLPIPDATRHYWSVEARLYGQPIQIGRVAVQRGDFVWRQDGVLVIPHKSLWSSMTSKN